MHQLLAPLAMLVVAICTPVTRYSKRCLVSCYPVATLSGSKSGSDTSAGGWAPAAVRCTFLDANHCPGAVMVRPIPLYLSPDVALHSS